MRIEPVTPRPIPSHVIAGIGSAFIASLLFGMAIGYYVLVGNGALPEPPRGLTPIWSAVIAVFAFVPISLWAATCAARPGREEVAMLRAELRSALDRFGNEAMEASRNAGKWEGFATGIRDTSDTGEVVSMHRSRRGS